MADDSIDIIEPMNFHPCNSPRGMLYYDLNVLTIDQQVQLNLLKRDTIRENEKYLAKHPEIRALIALVTRHVLLYRPRTDLHEFVAKYFARPKPDICDDMQRYIDAREPHIYQGDSAVLIHDESSEPSTAPSELVDEEVVDLEALPKEMLDEILQKAYVRLGIYTDDKEDKPPRVTGSDMSVIKSVISEVIRKAMGDQQQDILKYLLGSEVELPDEEQSEQTLGFSVLKPPEDVTDATSISDVELNQDTSELEDITVSTEPHLLTEETQSKQEIPEEDTLDFSFEVPQTGETEVTAEPTMQEVSESKQGITEPSQPGETVESPTIETETATETNFDTTTEAVKDQETVSEEP